MKLASKSVFNFNSTNEIRIAFLFALIRFRVPVSSKIRVGQARQLKRKTDYKKRIIFFHLNSLKIGLLLFGKKLPELKK